MGAICIGSKIIKKNIEVGVVNINLFTNLVIAAMVTQLKIGLS